MPDDIVPSGSGDDAGTPDPKPRSSAPAQTDGVDYFKKYTGLNTAHSKLLLERDQKDVLLSEAQAKIESLEIQVKTAVKPLQDKFDSLQKDFETAKLDAQKLQNQIAADKARAAMRDQLTEKYKDNPAVIEAWAKGDLKDRSDFPEGDEGTASFGQYMDRMALLVKPTTAATPDANPDAQPPAPGDRRDYLSGATPQPIRPYRQESNASAASLTKQLMDLDRSAPDYKTKFDNLTAQLDKALG